MSGSNPISAQEATERLIAGNKKYLDSGTNPGDISPQIRMETVEKGQHPYAIVLCCADSRVIPEDIFMAGLGELFVIRVAGNVLSPYQLGSIEYAADHLGCHLCVILGHTHCGAIDSAINLSGEGEGYIRFLTDEIKKAIGNMRDPYTASCLNAKVAALTVEMALNTKNRPADKELVVLTGIYHTGVGNVEFI